MKKIILLASVVTVASFASCKKAAKCECTTTTSQTYNGSSVPSSGTTTQVTTTEIAKTSKKTAAAICGNRTDVNTYTSTGGNVTVTTSNSTCSVK